MDLSSTLRLLLLGAAVGLAGCGGSGQVQATDSVTQTLALADARAAVEQARQEGAETNAFDELRDASRDLARAEAAFAAGEADRGTRFAELSRLKARFAEVTSRSRQASEPSVTGAEMDALRAAIAAALGTGE